MAIFNGMNISASGMTAQTMRMDTIAPNLANIDTTRDENGNTYRRKTVVFAEKNKDAFGAALAMQQARRATTLNGQGVKVTAIAEDHVTALKKVYDPAHPDADEDGYVTYPNVNIVTEMTNMIDSTRAYEANATAFTASKTIAMKGLDIGRSS